ncbi:hypothetical protein PUN28_014542 [Cardiocondyla obscurior]|uniref:Uncharacterized protein n=1 Tax=Cardiocondyla obscurior TaxID=286306 RepID=A0AAW2F1Y1_9HYME
MQIDPPSSFPYDPAANPQLIPLTAVLYFFPPPFIKYNCPRSCRGSKRHVEEALIIAKIIALLWESNRMDNITSRGYAFRDNRRKISEDGQSYCLSERTIDSFVPRCALADIFLFLPVTCYKTFF